jgi:hypothetical protein
MGDTQGTDTKSPTPLRVEPDITALDAAMTAPRAVLPEPWTVGAYAIQITDLGRHKDYDYTQFTLRKIGDEAIVAIAYKREIAERIARLLSEEAAT